MDGEVPEAPLSITPATAVYKSSITIEGMCPTDTADVVVGLSNDPDFKTGFAVYEIAPTASGAVNLTTKVQRTDGGDVEPRNGTVYALMLCLPADEDGEGAVGATTFELTGVGGSSTTTPPATSTSTPTSSTHTSSSSASTPVGSVTTPVVVATGTVAPSDNNDRLLVGAGIFSLLAGGGVLAMRKRLN